MSRVIAHVSGVGMVPGVSRNGRLYTGKIIREAVERAQPALVDGRMKLTEANSGTDGLSAETVDAIVHPLGQRTHHNAGDDSLQIVGRLTSLTCDDDDRMLWEADIIDTTDGWTTLELIDDSEGPAFLKGVSIRGDWLGTVRKVPFDGVLVETADGLDLQGLDYTQRPGIQGAHVSRVERTTPTTTTEETALARTPITESVQEARVAITEEAPTGGPAEQTAAAPAATPTPAAAAPAAPTKWADPSYHDEPRLPLDTAAQARESWYRLQESDTRNTYTGAQLKRVRERAQRGLAGHGIEALPNGWLAESEPTATPTAVVECLEYMPYAMCPEPEGSFSVRLDNGQVSIYISSWSMDPHDLSRVGRAAMDGAASALEQIEADLDGDGPAESTRAPRVTEAAPAEQAAPAVAAQSSGDVPTGDVDTTSTTEQEGEPGVSEPTSTTPAAPAGITLSPEQFDRWLAAQAAPAAAAAPAAVPAQPPVETAPAAGAVVENAIPAATPPAAPAPAATPAATPVTESEDVMIARLVQEALVAQGVVTAAPVTESTEARIARLVQEGVRTAAQGLAEQGAVGDRKGLVVNAGGVAESVSGTGDAALDAALEKPFHEHTESERRIVRNALGAEVAGVQITG